MEVTPRELDNLTLQLANTLMRNKVWVLERIDLDTQSVFVTVGGERFKLELTHLHESV